MKRLYWLMLPLAALVFGCATLGDDVIEPDVQLVNLALVDATLFEQKILVDLRIINPNDFDLPLDGLSFDLKVNGSRVARGSSTDSVNVPRLGDAVIQVTTHTNSVAMVRQLIDPPGDGRYEYVIDGNVFVKGFGKRKIPFEHQGELPTGPTGTGSPTL